MTRSELAFRLLLAATAAVFLYLIAFVFLRAPTAQLQAGGLTQKIFYFHVPAAYAMYLCGAVCLVASAAYLYRPTDARNAVAGAAAECAVVFGLLVLSSERGRWDGVSSLIMGRGHRMVGLAAVAPLR